MLRSFPLELLGVKAIMTSRVSTFAERPIVRSFSCFRFLVSRYGLSGVLLSGLVMTSNVSAPAPTLTRLTPWGLLPRFGGLTVGDVSVLYSSLDKEDIKKLRAWSHLPCSGRLPCGRNDRDSLRFCSHGYGGAEAFRSYYSSDLGPHQGGLRGKWSPPRQGCCLSRLGYRCRYSPRPGRRDHGPTWGRGQLRCPCFGVVLPRVPCNESTFVVGANREDSFLGGSSAGNLPGVEDGRGVEDDCHGVIVNQRRTSYLACQLSVFMT
jgi:hypothetical protein